MSNCKTIAICNQKGGVMGVQNDCLYSDTDYTEWYVDKYGDLRADESARKDDSVRAMLRIEPKPRRNAGRRMTVISTLSVCANNAAKSFIQTAQGRGFAILTVQKPISKPKKRRNALPKGRAHLPQKVCKICGKPFWPSNGQEVLCSEECKTINRRRKQLAYYYRKQSVQNAGEAI